MCLEKCIMRNKDTLRDNNWAEIASCSPLCTPPNALPNVKAQGQISLGFVEKHDALLLRNTTHSETRGCTTLCKVRLCVWLQSEIRPGSLRNHHHGWVGICTCTCPIWSRPDSIGNLHRCFPNKLCAGDRKAAATRTIRWLCLGHFSWVDAPNPPLQAHRIAVQLTLASGAQGRIL